MSIPKVIHYCWFGNKEKPQVVQDCISSWKLHLPDYKIIEWNENNTDLSHPYLYKTYKLKKWAFVSDFVRLRVLYEFGGIYLDTDMLILKSLNGFLKDTCFLGAEDEKYINAAIIGASKQHQFIEQCLTRYKKITLSNETNWQLISIPRIITESFRKRFQFYTNFDNKVEVGGVAIYPAHYFYPVENKNKADITNYRSYLSVESHAVHLWNASWVEPNEFFYLRRRKYLRGFRKVFNNIIVHRKISKAYLKKILRSIKKSISS